MVEIGTTTKPASRGDGAVTSPVPATQPVGGPPQDGQWSSQHRPSHPVAPSGVPRFLLVSLLPSTLFAVLVLALLGTGAPGQPRLSRLQQALTSMGLAEVAGIVVLVLTVSLLLQPLQMTILRLLEGYWDGSAIGRLPARIGIAWHRRRLRRLQRLVRRPARTTAEVRRSEIADSLLRMYPDQERLLPTMLGNILRAAEDRAGQRYGLETVLVWPRLYQLLYGSLRAGLVDSRNQLDAAARTCILLLLVTVLATIMLAAHGWWMVVPLVTLALSWLAYAGAMGAAAGYGHQLHIAFDLHRFDLLDALHLPLPDDPVEEYDLNEELSDFLATEMPVTLLRLERGYRHPQQAPHSSLHSSHGSGARMDGDPRHAGVEEPAVEGHYAG